MLKENNVADSVIANARVNIPGMNTLRFVLACWVMLVHYPVFAQLLGLTFKYEDLPNFGVLGWFYVHMVDPVPIFWALAGAVFAGAYRSCPEFSAKQFWVARISRLYPLHVLCLLITLITHYLLAKIRLAAFPSENGFSFLANVFLVSHWFINVDGPFNGVTWSISVELLAYVVFSILRQVRRDYITVICMLVSGIGFAVSPSSPKLSPFLCIWLFLLTNIVVTYYFVNNRRHLFLATLTFVGLSVVVSYFYSNYAILIRPVAIIMVTIAMFSRLPSWLDIQVLGDLTYATYLCHFPILEASVIILSVSRTNPQIVLSSPFQITYFMFVLAFSTLLLKVVESPSRRFLMRAMSHR